MHTQPKGNHVTVYSQALPDALWNVYLRVSVTKWDCSNCLKVLFFLPKTCPRDEYWEELKIIVCIETWKSHLWLPDAFFALNGLGSTSGTSTLTKGDGRSNAALLYHHTWCLNPEQLKTSQNTKVLKSSFILNGKHD